MKRRKIPDASEEQVLGAILEWLQIVARDGVWATVEPRGGFIRGKPTRKVYAAGIGVPDIVGCLGGRFVGIEVKARTGKLRDSQRDFGSRIQENGGFFVVCRNLDDVEQAIARIRSEIYRTKGGTT